MELSNQLSKNLEDLAQMVESRMDSFDSKLTQTQAGLKTTTTGDLTTLATDFAAFKEFVWKTLSMLRKQVELLSTGFDQVETRSRNKILLFHGLPEKSDEEVDKEVLTILKDTLKLLKSELSNVDICHRLGSKRDKPRPILVRFCGLRCKNIVWNSKTLLKGSGVTMSEFLTY